MNNEIKEDDSMQAQPTYQLVSMVTWADFSNYCNENALNVYDIMQMCNLSVGGILAWRDEGLVPSEAFEVIARRALN